MCGVVAELLASNGANCSAELCAFSSHADLAKLSPLVAPKLCRCSSTEGRMRAASSRAALEVDCINANRTAWFGALWPLLAVELLLLTQVDRDVLDANTVNSLLGSMGIGHGAL